MLSTELPSKSQEFIAQFSCQPNMQDDSVAPLFFRADNDVAHHVRDIAIRAKDIRAFEFKNITQESRLYYGGSSVLINTCHGTLVVPDERDHWFKPAAAGIAEYVEYSDLSRTAERELLEEIFIFSLDQSVRYVPPNTQEKVNPISALGFSVKRVREIGTITTIGNVFNDQVGSYEKVFLWDISSLRDFSVISHEEWYLGAHSGIVVCTYNNGNITGFFSGQQGYISFQDYGLHPTISQYLKK